MLILIKKARKKYADYQTYLRPPQQDPGNRLPLPQENEPVYLTTNGEGDLVVMSMEHYERLQARVDLFEKLAVAQAQWDEKLQTFGYRVLVIESYLVFYLLRGKTIEIHRVVHGSRNLTDII